MLLSLLASLMNLWIYFGYDGKPLLSCMKFLYRVKRNLVKNIIAFIHSVSVTTIVIFEMHLLQGTHLINAYVQTNFFLFFSRILSFNQNRLNEKTAMALYPRTPISHASPNNVIWSYCVETLTIMHFYHKCTGIGIQGTVFLLHYNLYVCSYQPDSSSNWICQIHKD